VATSLRARAEQASSLADELLEAADGLVASFDQNGPQILALLAERLSGAAGWSLLAEARELSRSRVIADPLSLNDVVTLGWITAAIRIRGDLDRTAGRMDGSGRTDGCGDDRWGQAFRRAILDAGLTPNALARELGLSPTLIGALQRVHRPPDGDRRVAAETVLSALDEPIENWFNGPDSVEGDLVWAVDVG
jgi:hypothetical protein